MISTYHSNYDINEIDITTSTNNGTILYFKLKKFKINLWEGIKNELYYYFAFKRFWSPQIH